MAYDQDLANRIRELIATDTGVTEKRMFGGLAFLIGGHLAVSVSGRGVSCSVATPPTPTRCWASRPRARSRCGAA